MIYEIKSIKLKTPVILVMSLSFAWSLIDLVLALLIDVDDREAGLVALLWGALPPLLSGLAVILSLTMFNLVAKRFGGLKIELLKSDTCAAPVPEKIER